MKCRLLTNMWEDAGVEYHVLWMRRLKNSTGVELQIEQSDGSILLRTVASHQIEWIEDE